MKVLYLYMQFVSDFSFVMLIFLFAVAYPGLAATQGNVEAITRTAYSRAKAILVPEDVSV